jgi:ABC-2 type transport system ATP-binding protein
MHALIEVRDLVKHYPGVKAVDGVDFKVEAGTCFGLLGPNGAGKTTTLEILEGIGSASSGEVLFEGRGLDDEYRQRIGIQFQTTALQDFQTVRESLDMFSRLYLRQADYEKLIDLCHLREFLNRDTRKLSGGQRQRLLLAIALVNDPDLVFLDEPTTGLDPQARRNFWSLIEGIKSSGKTIVMTTHYMEEAYLLCDEVAIMDRGQIIARGEPQALVREHFPASVIRLPLAAVTEEVRSAIEMEQRNGELELYTDDVNAALNRLSSLGVSLEEMQVSSPTLEDLFLKLTGHGLRG